MSHTKYAAVKPGSITCIGEWDKNKIQSILDYNDTKLTAPFSPQIIIHQAVKILPVHDETNYLEPSEFYHIGQPQFTEHEDHVAVVYPINPYSDDYILSLKKEYAVSDINDLRTAKILEGTNYATAAGTGLFGVGINDYQTIISLSDRIQSGTITFMDATGGYWKSEENVNVVFTESEFTSLGNLLVVNGTKIARESHNAKSLVNALTDLSTADSDIDTIIENYKNYTP